MTRPAPRSVAKGADQPVDSTVGLQVDALERAVRKNPMVVEILDRVPGLELPGWYLGAGAVAGTVWNLLHGFDAKHGIKDYDLVYYDSSNLTAAAEQVAEGRARELFADLGVKLDVTNEARVHLWYHERFGRSITPYRSTEHAISTWPTTATSIGVRDDQGGLQVCAPFGLRDLFAMVIRPNRAFIDQRVYETKATAWSKLWPRLSVIPWQ